MFLRTQFGERSMPDFRALKRKSQAPLHSFRETGRATHIGGIAVTATSVA
jgi:hypothetical protein